MIIKRRRKPGFVTLSRESMIDLARRHRAPSWFGTLVLLIIKANDDGYVLGSERWLPEEIGMSYQTFRRHRKKLVDTKEVEFEPGRNQYQESVLRIVRYDELCSIISAAVGAVGATKMDAADKAGATTGATTGATKTEPADALRPAETRPLELRELQEQDRTANEGPDGDDPPPERCGVCGVHESDLPGAGGLRYSGDGRSAICETCHQAAIAEKGQAEPEGDDDDEEEAAAAAAGGGISVFLGRRVRKALANIETPAWASDINDELARDGLPLRPGTLRSVLADLQTRGFTEQDQLGRWKPKRKGA